MNQADVTAVILAGGRGQRMGGADKGLMEFAGRPMIEHILEAIKPQCAALLINANRNQQCYACYHYPVITDELHDYQGPLAGFSVALERAKTPLVVTLPCDAPNVPENLVSRLLRAMEEADTDIAVAHDGERLQPVYALMHRKLSVDLKQFLAAGKRKIDQWYALHHIVHADFSDMPQVFHNINSREQRALLQARVKE